jgi:cell division protein FtsI (penicillin-binding protein 3)
VNAESSFATARPERLRLAGQRQQSLALVHNRLMVLMLLFLGLLALIALRLAFLAVFGGASDRVSTRDILIPPRADIVDRNGVPLARTIDAWAIGVHPDQLVNKPEDVAARLAQLLPERSYEQYLAILKSHRHFFYLRRRAMPDLVAQVNAIGEPAIELQRESERLYPQARLAAHVLGWVNADGQGVSGIERALNDRLSDAAGRAHPVQLSIDARVQAAMEQELGIAMNKFSAVGATGLVLDVNTAEVVAMASLPNFNPNAPGDVPPQPPGSTEPGPRFDRVTQGVYELGSTFKPITFANAIQRGVVTSMTKKSDATAPLQIGRFKIHDDHAQNRWLNVPEAMVHSSNIVTARVADEIGEQGMRDIFTKLGFAGPPAIELKEKSPALWPGYWSRATTMTVGFGHGIAVTPLHLALAYAALVNGGIWRPGTVLKRGPDNPVPAGRRIISPSTSFRIRQLMRLVVNPVTGGTGKKADVPGFRLGGKTGTAEKAQAGGYAHHSLVSTFAGVFPMDDPKYVIIMMLDEPHGTADTFGYATAAWVVGPAINKVLPRVGPMLGVYPDLHKDIDQSELLPLIWHAPGKSGNDE